MLVIVGDADQQFVLAADGPVVVSATIKFMVYLVFVSMIITGFSVLRTHETVLIFVFRATALLTHVRLQSEYP